jgi:hypothetical protein
VSGSILQYLGGELGTTPTGHLAYGAPSAASGPSALLVACCLAVAAGSVGIIALTIRRRVAGRP